MIDAATRRIDELYPVWPGHRPLLDRMRDTYAHRSEHVERQREQTGPGDEDREAIEHREIQRTVIDAEREALLRLRAEGTIDDDVLRALERELDLDERRIVAGGGRRRAPRYPRDRAPAFRHHRRAPSTGPGRRSRRPSAGGPSIWWRRWPASASRPAG